ncbi:conjugal transfer protein [Paenibacillus sp. 1A_MP2]|uniref:conjugal transfer protein n=1 Tax=Paenibacillus sp. 1A_MP2 TaxID=3457495 RepID=UPI003FCE3914
MRKFAKYIVIVVLCFAAIAGLKTLFSIFTKEEVVQAQDYSNMQKTAEYFVTLYLNWVGPLEQRQLKMNQIAPSVVPYLIKGNQSVNFSRAVGLPYFSNDRGFVDVTAWTTITEKNELGEKISVPRKYNITVLFLRQSDGTYVIDSVPTLRIDKSKQDFAKQENDASKNAVVDMLTPVLKVFLPAYLSGDMSTAQNLILPESTILSQNGEYSYVGIESVRIRETADNKTNEYVADVTVTVKDKETKATINILINMLVRQDETKFYVIRAVT